MSVSVWLPGLLALVSFAGVLAGGFGAYLLLGGRLRDLWPFADTAEPPPRWEDDRVRARRRRALELTCDRVRAQLAQEKEVRR